MLLRKEILFVAIVICLAMAANADRIRRMYALCPPSFTRIGSECYYISSNRVNWLDAHFECKDRNSRLAEPIKYEDRALRKYLMHNDDPERFDIWIGGIYNWEQKKWQWGYNGRDVIYQSFSQMSPGWSARSCVEEHRYICQHHMPYVTERNRQKIYNKWNVTYPNQWANEKEVVLSDDELQGRQISRLQRQRNSTKKRVDLNGNDDRRQNSIDWQQPLQQNRNHKRRQRLRNQRKRIPNNFNGDVDNNIDSVNGNNRINNEFSPDTEYGLRGNHRNRTRNPNQNRNSDLFGNQRRRRKQKHSTTSTTSTTTTKTSTTESPTYPSSSAHQFPTTETPSIRYVPRDPTSAEERFRVENEHIRKQEELRRREIEEENRQKEETAIRERNRIESEKRRAEIEERARQDREQQYIREQEREQEFLRQQQADRKRLQWEQDRQKSREDSRDRGSNSVEVPADEPNSSNQIPESDTEERKPIDDSRIEQLRQHDENKRRRNNLRERLRKLKPEQQQEYFAKRAERNKKRGTSKRENVSTSIPDQ